MYEICAELSRRVTHNIAQLPGWNGMSFSNMQGKTSAQVRVVQSEKERKNERKREWKIALVFEKGAFYRFTARFHECGNGPREELLRRNHLSTRRERDGRLGMG